MAIQVSVPAKLILSGEHAIFQTGVAMTVAIDARSTGIFRLVPLCPGCTDSGCKISVSLGETKHCYTIVDDEIVVMQPIVSGVLDCPQADSPNNNSHSPNSLLDGLEFKVIEGIRQLLQVCITKSGFQLQSNCLHIEIRLAVPPGSGLGSSAVLSVIMAGGVLRLAKNNTLQVNDLAFECEKIFHANPSGIDNSTVVNGGFCWFSDGRLVEKLNCPLGMRFFIVNTGIVKDTKQVLANLNEKWGGREDEKAKILAQIGEVSEEMKSWFHDYEMFLAMIEKNQRFLERYGVSCKEIDEIIQLGYKFGLTGKISGAGCGGCVFFPHLDRKTPKPFKEVLQYRYFKVRSDEDGILITEIE